MSVKILRNNDGVEVGSVHTNGDSHILRNKRGTELGRYDAKTDTTKDATGKIVGRGNLLTYLLDP